MSLLILTFGICFYKNRFQLNYLLALSKESGFLVGAFTILVGTWFHKIGNLKNIFMGGSCYLICFSMGLLFFDNHSAPLMFQTPQRIFRDPYICPNVENSTRKAEEPKIGCELVHRAFKLGYIKDLGACGVTDTPEKLQVCTLRQFDEPLLHYSFRLLVQSTNQIKSEWKDLLFWHRILNVFAKQISHIESVFGHLRAVMRNAPRASHHIFTNLPEPQNGKSLKGRVESNYESSWAFENVYKKMLFDPSYGEPVGLDKEYTVHWDSPVDSCEKLASNPTDFLKKIGAFEQLKVVLNRFLEQTDIEILNIQIKSIITGKPVPPPPPPPEAEAKARPFLTSIISFQCFMKLDGSPAGETNGEGAFKLTKRQFQLFGYNYTAQDFRFRNNNVTAIGMLKYFAQTMAEDFSYKEPENHLLLGSEFLKEGDYPLSRLEYLKYTDLLSENEWLQNRQDLMVVYPYYHYFHRFIESFRQLYRSQRTRL